MKTTICYPKPIYLVLSGLLLEYFGGKLEMGKEIRIHDRYFRLIGEALTPAEYSLPGPLPPWHVEYFAYHSHQPGVYVAPLT